MVLARVRASVATVATLASTVAALAAAVAVTVTAVVVAAVVGTVVVTSVLALRSLTTLGSVVRRRSNTGGVNSSLDMRIISKLVTLF